MIFGLIICTYKRPEAIEALLNSIYCQSLIPDEILIVDGSPDERTSHIVRNKRMKNLKYFKVDRENLGLTKQRNFGISQISKENEVICFLDDDVILSSQYFQNLVKTYDFFPDAIGVGGYILNEVSWRKGVKGELTFEDFEFDGWVRKLGSRNSLRKKLGLLSKDAPGVMPRFSHGLSVSFLPPSGKTYPVEFFMGGVASYRKELFEQIRFSRYFEGYGLYEDMDFCLRASRKGKLYVNTSAGLYHHHHEGGRPNNFKYGKMVVRNGWYVWRLKHPSPNVEAICKWHAIGLLLTIVRIGNAVSTNKRKAALQEGFGRIFGWLSLFLDKPKIDPN